MLQHFKRHDRHSPPGPHGRENLSVQADLEIVRGKAKRKVRPINVPTYLIGTASDCDLVLGDPQFSEVHAYIRIVGDEVSFRHLGFEPEVTVNGKRVGRAILSDGDLIQSGPYELKIHLQLVGRDTDDLEDESSLDLEESEMDIDGQAGVDRVEALLEDIREALYPATASIRIYDEQPPRAQSA